MSSTVTTCPTGCGRSKKAEKILCPSCWRALPDDVREEVYYAESDRDSDVYLTAVDRAVIVARSIVESEASESLSGVG